jgi:hypothetical protein
VPAFTIAAQHIIAPREARSARMLERPDVLRRSLSLFSPLAML